MSIQSFGIIRVLVLGFSHGNLRKKCRLDVVPVKRHILYYREESGASFQRL
jgi:hypothetical protein